MPFAAAVIIDDPAESGGMARPPPAVLVVNDRQSQRVAIRSMLVSLEVDVVEVDSGRAALRAVFDRAFAVILMDVRMPAMDGYETSFVMGLCAASNDEVLVRSIIDLAHNLGLTVVAEGVEDETALGLLVEYGCDSVQGYLLARPHPIEDLNIWLTESPYSTNCVRGAQTEQRPRDDSLRPRLAAALAHNQWPRVMN